MARRYAIRQDAAPVAPISGIDYRTALNEEQYAAVSSEPVSYTHLTLPTT